MGKMKAYYHEELERMKEEPDETPEEHYYFEGQGHALSFLQDRSYDLKNTIFLLENKSNALMMLDGSHQDKGESFDQCKCFYEGVWDMIKQFYLEKCLIKYLNVDNSMKRQSVRLKELGVIAQIEFKKFNQNQEKTMNTKQEIDQKIERLREIDRKIKHFKSLQDEINALEGLNNQRAIVFRKSKDLSFVDISFLEGNEIEDDPSKLVIWDELAWLPHPTIYQFVYQRCIMEDIHYKEVGNRLLGSSILEPIVKQNIDIIELAYDKLPDLLQSIGTYQPPPSIA